MIVVHWSRDGSSVYLSPGLMMAAWLAARSSALTRPRIVLTGWLPGAVLLSRGIVPFAVLLAARRGERSGTDMRWLFLVTATSARLWQRRFQLWWL
tara:strand:+ start:185 stop:472 length:288 start_codon:yes stop_codon:yes gene_type:complete